jgi:ABC-type transporter Mla subunit MlaD
MVPVTQVLASADKAIGVGTGLIGDLRSTLEASRKDIAAILRKLQEMEDSAKGLMGRADGIIADNREDIRGSISGVHDTVTKTGKTVDSLSAEIEKVSVALDRVLENARGLSGDARGMVAESRPVLEDTVLELRELIRNLRRFSRTVSETPNALILGASPEGRK